MTLSYSGARRGLAVVLVIAVVFTGAALADVLRGAVVAGTALAILGWTARDPRDGRAIPTDPWTRDVRGSLLPPGVAVLPSPVLAAPLPPRREHRARRRRLWPGLALVLASLSAAVVTGRPDDAGCLNLIDHGPSASCFDAPVISLAFVAAAVAFVAATIAFLRSLR